MLDSVQSTVKIFGERIGYPQLELNSQGVLHLTIDGVGELLIEAQETIFITLLRYYDFLSKERMLATLAMCHPFSPKPFFPHAVLHEEHFLGFSVKISRARFEVSTLEAVLQFLQTLQDDLQNHTD
jgi:hypothetical protein